jgi:hypothetical protein
MPKRVKQRKPKDVNQMAHFLVAQTTDIEPQQKRSHKKKPIPAELSAYMSAIGKKGGKRSGKKRLENIPEGKRTEIAMKAARARWENHKKISE